jgi:hypothetical protein
VQALKRLQTLVQTLVQTLLQKMAQTRARRPAALHWLRLQPHRVPGR